MGFVPQRFRTYGGIPTSAQVIYISLIEKAIQTDLVSVLAAINPSLVECTPAKMGEVKDFGSLASRSQTRGRAVWELDEATQTQKIEAWGAFQGLAQEVGRRSGKAPL